MASGFGRRRGESAADWLARLTAVDGSALDPDDVDELTLRLVQAGGAARHRASVSRPRPYGGARTPCECCPHRTGGSWRGGCETGCPTDGGAAGGPPKRIPSAAVLRRAIILGRRGCGPPIPPCMIHFSFGCHDGTDYPLPQPTEVPR